MKLNFSVIDREFSIYKNKIVILFGTGEAAMYVMKHMKNKGIHIDFFCDNNSKKWGESIENIKVVSPEELTKLYSDTKNEVIIQIATSFEKEIKQQLFDLGIKEIVSFSEFQFISSQIEILDLLDHKAVFSREELQINRAQSELLKVTQNVMIDATKCLQHYNDTLLMFLSPPKTGSTTIENACKKMGYPIISNSHTMKCMKKEIVKNVENYHIKIIAGIRDPIAQTLSLMYDALFIFGLDNDFISNNSVQRIFDKYFSDDILNKKFEGINLYQLYLDEIGRTYDELQFFDNMYKKFWGIDVFQYDFDKEKGCSVIRKGNIEILIYQLEKFSQLNDIIKDFIGADNLYFGHSNTASDKWYNESYQECKKHIIFSAEYLNAIYNSKFMKHFYSDMDITKFHNNWSKHIR